MFLIVTIVSFVSSPGPPPSSIGPAHSVPCRSKSTLAGSDGCNRITGTYELNGDRVTFRQMAATQMACPNEGDGERQFRNALQSATRLTVTGDRLELFEPTGTRLAAFTAGGQPAVPSSALGLAGTSWQLVKFQGSDGTTLTPDDRGTYTIEFGADGRLTARIDCNRGHGIWTSSGANQIEFGPLGLTRAKCPDGSLHDEIVKQWGNIRSYILRDGHLFLALRADGGIYEFERVPHIPYPSIGSVAKKMVLDRSQ
jgi:heat shock protein HslJ